MGMSVGEASIALVEFRHGSIAMDAFKSRLELVCQMLDNGALGGSYHGSDEHLRALDAVEAHIRKVRAFVAEVTRPGRG